MQRRSAPLIDIVRMEEKEAKLKSFVQTVVEKSDNVDGSPTDQGTILLLARSPESPVAKAVAALVLSGVIARPIQTIFAIAPREGVSAGAQETLMALDSANARMLGDVRLFDAHEQLVLGNSASWVGDCMRRDPMKRDAYECFAADCAKTAGWARRSHQRLWEAGEAVLPDTFFLATAVTADLAAVNVAANEADSSSDPFAGSSS